LRRASAQAGTLLLLPLLLLLPPLTRGAPNAWRCRPAWHACACSSGGSSSDGSRSNSSSDGSSNNGSSSEGEQDKRHVHQVQSYNMFNGSEFNRC
jgi:hypothetical protein